MPVECGTFAYMDRYGKPRELTRSFFRQTINGWLAAHGRPKIGGDSFRAGGANFYAQLGHQ